MERKVFWPIIKMDNMEGDWWREVMETTTVLNEFFSQSLDDEADFTMRAMVHILVVKSSDEVAWYMEGSAHLSRMLNIYDLLHGENEVERELGKGELVHLIEDFTKDMLLLVEEKSKGEGK